MTRALGAALAVAAAIAVSAPADAATFRFANDADSNSMDPYARQETFLLSFDSNIYEPLVRRDAHNLALEPALAVSWTQLETNPLVWRFKLRPNVKFSDGTPFSAEDVVFSYTRVLDPGSNMKSVLATVKEVRKVDDLTVDFETVSADPILPDEITNWDIMSKAWCEKNNAQHPADLTKNEESYATNHAMGTGPFMLKDREPDVKTVLVKNPTWWDTPKHNLDEAIFQRVANPATRVAALLSGELDMLYTVPPQDVDRIANTKGFKIVQAPELRTIYLGLDVFRPELLESNVKGKNPYKDHRVRQAMLQAIDEDAIVNKVMRGQGKATALMVGPGVKGYSAELDKRLPYDPAASKKLLSEAGYPNGFETELWSAYNHTTAQKVAQFLQQQLQQIGIKTKITLLEAGQRVEKVESWQDPATAPVRLYYVGWSTSTGEADWALRPLLSGDSWVPKLSNYTFYKNPKFDADIKNAQLTTDTTEREKLYKDAQEIAWNDAAWAPLVVEKLLSAHNKKLSGVYVIPDASFNFTDVDLK
jgi:peptide/nickel transport system substrate-binding protein